MDFQVFISQKPANHPLFFPCQLVFLPFTHFYFVLSVKMYSVGIETLAMRIRFFRSKCNNTLIFWVPDDWLVNMYFTMGILRKNKSACCWPNEWFKSLCQFLLISSENKYTLQGNGVRGKYKKKGQDSPLCFYSECNQSLYTVREKGVIK